MSVFESRLSRHLLIGLLSFGAVLEEFEVRDALMNALAGRANGSYTIGA